MQPFKTLKHFPDLKLSVILAWLRLSQVTCYSQSGRG